MYDMLRNSLKNREGLLKQLYTRIEKRLKVPCEPSRHDKLMMQRDNIIKVITCDVDEIVSSDSKPANPDSVLLVPVDKVIHSISAESKEKIRSTVAYDKLDMALHEATLEIAGLKRKLKTSRKKLDKLKFELRNLVLDLQRAEVMIYNSDSEEDASSLPVNKKK